MGIVTTSPETAFSQSPETIYDFVTNPANRPRTCPGSAHITGLPDDRPLKVGDIWAEAGPDGDRAFTRQLANVAPFTRTTIEDNKHARLPDQLFQQANPAKIDAYHAAIARELKKSHVDH